MHMHSVFFVFIIIIIVYFQFEQKCLLQSILISSIDKNLKTHKLYNFK